MGSIFSIIKTRRETRDTYRSASTPSSESKVDTNFLLDAFERDHESDTGNPSGQPSTSLGVVMPRDYKIIKTKSDGESSNQLDDDDEQKVIDQMRAVGKQAFWLHKRLHINQKLNESVEGTENSLVDLQLYLLDVEEYLKTVPNHLQQIQEYKKLKKRYEEAKIACTYATEWLQSSKSWHKYPSDEALLIDGVSNH